MPIRDDDAMMVDMIENDEATAAIWKGGKGGGKDGKGGKGGKGKGKDGGKVATRRGGGCDLARIAM
eukprot:12094801-Heterocapsa_arctica.AAC.1